MSPVPKWVCLWHIIRVAEPCSGVVRWVVSSRTQVHLTGENRGQAHQPGWKDRVTPVASLLPKVSFELHRGPGPVRVQRRVRPARPSPDGTSMLIRRRPFLTTPRWHHL